MTKAEKAVMWLNLVAGIGYVAMFVTDMVRLKLEKES